MPRTNVAIVGAGPGGLTAAMILARRGLGVTVFEKEARVGGRNAPIQLGGYTFDTGPTFLMMRFILDDVFREAGRRTDDYLDFTPLDPYYRLKFGEREFSPSADLDKTREAMRENYPEDAEGLDRFMKVEQARFERLFPCLQKDYGSLKEYFAPAFLRALPHLSLSRTVHSNLGRYFQSEDMKLAFAFQSKYLGMSPWACPAFFTMLSYIEHAYGVFHVTGGLNKISQAMAKVLEEHGGEIRLSTPVDSLIIENRRARGVRLAGGGEERFDDVIINADFGHAMNHLVPPESLSRYKPEKLKNWRLSCSTFMLYLGVNRRYDDLAHHNILFADDYRRNVDEIQKRGIVSEDPSIYVHNASVTDPTLAPEGKSAIYILVPMPNQRAGIDWKSVEEPLAEKVIDMVQERGGFAGLREGIEKRLIITPQDWEQKVSVYEGATFNLAHTLMQLLYFRPHNRFEELGNCYLVGGGTHPGSGLPTIYESGRITSNLICMDRSIPFDQPLSLEETIAFSTTG